MHLDEGIMRSMSDSHLIASLRNTQDDLTDTPVELELLRRLEKWQDIANGFEVETAEDMEEVLETHNSYIAFFSDPKTADIADQLTEFLIPQEATK